MQNKYGVEVLNLGVSVHTWEYVIKPHEKSVTKNLQSMSMKQLETILDFLSSLNEDMTHDEDLNTEDIKPYLNFWYACVSEIYYSKYCRNGQVINTLC